MLDFATQHPDHDLRHALDEAAERWSGNAYTDYSYHPIFTEGASPDAIDQISELVQEGFPSFKIFTTNIRPLSPGAERRHTDFGWLAAIMERVASSGGMLMVHSEDDEMVSYNYAMAKEQGRWDWWNMHLIHTNLSEEVSFRRVIRLAQRKGAPSISSIPARPRGSRPWARRAGAASRSTARRSTTTPASTPTATASPTA